MKHKVRFLLKNPKAKERTAINMIFSWGFKDINGKYRALKYATGQTVSPDNWIADEQVAEGPYCDNINSELDGVKNEAIKLYLKHKDDDLTPTDLKHKLDIRLDRVNSGEINNVNESQLFIDYLDRYISEIESGVRKTYRDPLRPMSSGTVKNIKAFRTKITDYEKEIGCSLSFSDIDMNFYKSFVEWLGSQHTINSTGKTIKQLKTIMQAALNDELHSNISFKNKEFKVLSELVDTIYLTEEEVSMLFQKENLSEHHEIARDLFLLGCFTLQRVSDWSKISIDNIDITPNGTRVLKITQQKTGAKVVIPLVSPRLISILEKYDYQPPKMPDQKINDYIKEVSKDSIESKGDPSSLHLKSDRITTHTARRTGCTNLYRAGIPLSKIMKLSGHKTESEVKRYIRVTDEENADELAGYDYFKKN